MNGSVDHTIETQPTGHEYMVFWAPADTSTPGIKEVVATCGTSAATCTVTVVKAASLMREGVTSQPNAPREEETPYISAGGANDIILLTASSNPAVDPKLLEGCFGCAGAEPLEENSLAAASLSHRFHPSFSGVLYLESICHAGFRNSVLAKRSRAC